MCYDIECKPYLKLNFFVSFMQIYMKENGHFGGKSKNKNKLIPDH